MKAKIKKGVGLPYVGEPTRSYRGLTPQEKEHLSSLAYYEFKERKAEKLSQEQETELIIMWEQGESTKDIAKAIKAKVGVTEKRIRKLLEDGVIERRRSSITKKELEAVDSLVKHGTTAEEIAVMFGISITHAVKLCKREEQ